MEENNHNLNSLKTAVILTECKMPDFQANKIHHLAEVPLISMGFLALPCCVLSNVIDHPKNLKVMTGQFLYSMSSYCKKNIGKKKDDKRRHALPLYNHTG